MRNLIAALMLVIVTSGCAEQSGVYRQISAGKIETVAVYKLNVFWFKQRYFNAQKDSILKDSADAVKLFK